MLPMLSALVVWLSGKSARSTALTLAFVHAFVTLAFAIHASEHLNARADWKTTTAFEPLAVPGDPGLGGEASHHTSWNLLTLSPGSSIQFFIGVDGLNLWLVALASYSPSDPVWFFNTGSSLAPANFAGRVGAFLAELSFQTVGYAAYLIPVILVVVGWHYFWCRTIDAVYTKLVGAAMLFGCSSALLHLTVGRVDFGPRAFRAGGYLGEWLGGFMSEYLKIGRAHV